MIRTKKGNFIMSEKIVLIDGHSILNRAFYGVPDLTNSEGMHTNAVYGFLNIMFKILDTEKPEYLTVAFDVKKPTFRHEIFKEYKGTRKPMPEELRQQVPIIQQVLEAMGITIVKRPGFEADDILGTIAKTAEAQGKEVTLVSGDRDLLQLASENIKISIPKTKKGGSEVEEYHTEDVIEKYGVTPVQIIDMKGLMGDTADNIPGVAGVGEKTAVKILKAFPSVEQAYEHIEEVEPKRARELLRAGKDMAFLSKKLATIKTDCELDYNIADAKLENIFTPEAFEWVKKLELKSLVNKFDMDTRSSIVIKPMNFKFLKKKAEIEKFAKELIKNSPDVVGVSFFGDEWSNSGVQKKKNKKKNGGQMAFVFDDISAVSLEDESDSLNEYLFLGLSLSYETDGTFETISILKNDETDGDFLIDIYKKIEKKIPHIALFDWKNELHLTSAVENYSEEKEAPSQAAFDDSDFDMIFNKVSDVSIAAYLINPLKDSYEPDDIARDYLNMTIPSYSERFGKSKLSEVIAEVEEFYFNENTDEEKNIILENLLDYTGELSFVAAQGYKNLKDELEKTGMMNLYREVEIPTAYFLYQMERVGVKADIKVLEKLAEKLDRKIVELEGDIYDLAGEEFNINSPKQLGVILFEKMKLPFAKKTKTGYSTSADILEKLKTEDPIISKILDYRQFTKLKSTYAEGLAVFIESDNRIHGKFNQMITATGRISSTEPNLQNIPIRMEMGREFRKVFKAKEGCVFLDADYSQIELRVLADMSGDEHLIEAYKNGDDIHRSTASKVFHTPFEEVTELQRRNAKAVNFGIVYGISAFGLSQDLGTTRKEADEIIKKYFATYPAIKAFLDEKVEDAKKTGYSYTKFGRRRPVPEIKSSNFMQRSFGERIAMNSPIQGTAADIIKIAMIKVARKLKEEKLKSRIVLQVHDELLVETSVDEIDKVKEILISNMQSAASLKVPLIAEVEQGDDWFEAH